MYSRLGGACRCLTRISLNLFGQRDEQAAQEDHRCQSEVGVLPAHAAPAASSTHRPPLCPWCSGFVFSDSPERVRRARAQGRTACRVGKIGSMTCFIVSRSLPQGATIDPCGAVLPETQTSDRSGCGQEHPSRSLDCIRSGWTNLLVEGGLRDAGVHTQVKVAVQLGQFAGSVVPRPVVILDPDRQSQFVVEVQDAAGKDELLLGIRRVERLDRVQRRLAYSYWPMETWVTFSFFSISQCG